MEIQEIAEDAAEDKDGFAGRIAFESLRRLRIGRAGKPLLKTETDGAENARVLSRCVCRLEYSTGLLPTGCAFKAGFAAAPNLNLNLLSKCMHVL